MDVQYNLLLDVVFAQPIRHSGVVSSRTVLKYVVVHRTVLKYVVVHRTVLKYVTVHRKVVVHRTTAELISIVSIAELISMARDMQSRAGSLQTHPSC